MDDLVITRSIDIEAERGRVWQTLTDPSLLSQWFGDGAEFELRPGARGRLIWNEHGVFGMLVVAVSEPDSVTYRWTKDSDVEVTDDNSTEVTFTLEEAPLGTRVTVMERGFEVYGDGARAQFEGDSEGWETELAELRELLERQDSV
ncbi:uncharacterized protein YndB with AHSA1/START domain [Diaminobutyricimonas aerilata]|uniref:Uncharacterized protein YndB with AHSA1/START domain n=1 Tax=Diaminobutyricimonas aerilata TaxID=1162967 RepID=A0A2M9CJB1_9MICO|nr:SRPBCC domain-containing protein [Diaminobutyricimonas aerilata]PJJ72001.1 uncharacterized protein YndB with AHSA1/START domain [Diaminobutyricimonas aerilata]